MTESQAPLNTGPRYDPVVHTGSSSDPSQPDAMSSINLDESIFTMDKPTPHQNPESSLKRKRSEPEIEPESATREREANFEPPIKMLITEELGKHLEDFKTHTTNVYRQLNDEFVKLIQEERHTAQSELQAERRAMQDRVSILNFKSM